MGINLARGFTSVERERIKQQMIEKGSQFFRTLGLQKTSIHQITDAVGIAQGTFYNFFSSKEALYFTVLEREEKMMREQLLNISLNKNEPIDKYFERFLMTTIRLVENNSLIRDLYVGEHFAQLLRKIPEKQLANHLIADEKMFKQIIKHWESLGIQLNISPQIVVSIFRSLFILTIHQSTIGEATYEETLSVFVQSLTKYLIK